MREGGGGWGRVGEGGGGWGGWGRVGEGGGGWGRTELARGYFKPSCQAVLP